MNYIKQSLESRETSLRVEKLQLLKKHGLEGHIENGEITADCLILHESEFLKEVTKQIKELYNLEPTFLEEATGVDSAVFEHLLAAECREGILSIIKATVGILNLAKLAIDYYGIAYFFTISADPAEVTDLGEGYYMFAIC